jgi:Tol biopolymer transport system component
VDFYQRDVSPDPSPDGTRVAYSTDRVNATMPVIRVLTLATRAVSSIDVPGVTPRWSPDGSRIAYVTTKPSWGYLDDRRVMRSPGFLSLMNPDGTQQQIIPTGTKTWAPHFDWSADGKYIIAVSNAGLVELVEVATGRTIPLAFSRGFYLPAWKPQPS